MNPKDEYQLMMTRRHFFGRTAMGIGTAALASLFNEESFAADNPHSAIQNPQLSLPHFAPKAKRIIYMFQSGAPSQLDMFDPKPLLEKMRGQDLPDSIRQGQRLTGMTAYQANFPIAPSIYKFAQYGKSGQWLSELIPHTTKIVDDVAFI